jgi:hypothetical protein
VKGTCELSEGRIELLKRRKLNSLFTPKKIYNAFGGFIFLNLPWANFVRKDVKIARFFSLNFPSLFCSQFEHYFPKKTSFFFSK